MIMDWMYSKVIAIVICGYGVWILTSIKVVHFTTLSSVVITTLCGGSSIAYGIYGKQRKVFPWKHMELVYWEEVIFFVVFFYGHIWQISSGSSWN